MDVEFLSIQYFCKLKQNENFCGLAILDKHQKKQGNSLRIRFD